MKNSKDLAILLGVSVQELSAMKLNEFASRCYDIGLTPKVVFAAKTNPDTIDEKEVDLEIKVS